MYQIPTSFPMDGSSLYFMAQAAPDHTNVYRFTITLTEPVCPQTLQKAADSIVPRFPTIAARFCPGAFSYTMAPVSQPPQALPDPGLLHTMSKEELERCAYRLYYREDQIILEFFHALADGYGALTFIRGLAAAYLHLRHGFCGPERENMLLAEPDWDAEWEDAYRRHSGGTVTALPQRFACRIPGGSPGDGIGIGSLQVSTQKLRQAAKQSGVSVTTLLSELMAEAVMELQVKNGNAKRPVRIMVPVDLRRQFPSKTLRNFVLYALPTLEAEDLRHSRHQRLMKFQEQLRRQLDRNFLAGQITRNQKIQTNPLFRLLPTSWKFCLMRLSNLIFGETNSSITLTNLGPVAMSDTMATYIKNIEVFLTPRRKSPYNCGLLTCGDITNITISRFGSHTALEDSFFQKLQTLLNFDTPVV